MDNDELLVVIKDMFESTTEKLEKRLDQKINNLGVAVEALRSDVKAVAEGHSLLDAKIDRVEKNLTGKFDRVDAKVDQLDKKLTGKIDSVKDELKAEIKIVQTYVIGVDEKLNEHDVMLKRAK